MIMEENNNKKQNIAVIILDPQKRPLTTWGSVAEICRTGKEQLI